MTTLFNSYPHKLVANSEPPCLSLYQPTHRHHPDNQQDPIRFKNLVKTLEESLKRKYPTQEIRAMLAPYAALLEESDFWNHSLDGLAVLSNAREFQVFRLQRTVPEIAVAADSFHTKPLLRILQSADRFQILALTRSQIRLYEGSRYALDEIELAPEVPQTITDALGDEFTEPHLTVASYGMCVKGPAMRHGHGSKKDELDVDVERFFRVIDRAITDYHSKPSSLPLMLAALPEYHTPFRRVSKNPFLLVNGIDVNPEALSPDALRERAWKVIAPQYFARMDDLAEAFRQAKAKDFGDDDLAVVANAAVAGRINTLLLEADRHVAGKLNTATGAIEFEDLHHPDPDDLLDDLGEHVLNLGGKVVVVPADRMPSSTGCAAIYKF